MNNPHPQRKKAAKLPFPKGLGNDIRSKESSIQFSVTFRNLHEEPVRLYWIDFKGNLKFFGVLRNTKADDKGITLETFVTHPWVAVDHRTGEMMAINFKSIFRPVSRENFMEEIRKAARLQVSTSCDSSGLQKRKTNDDEEMEIAGCNVDAFITPNVLKLEVFCCLKICKIMTEASIKEIPLPQNIIENILKIRENWMLPMLPS